MQNCIETNMKLQNEVKPKKKCNICGKSLKVYNMKKHIKEVHKKVKENRCDICDQSFSRPWVLKKHMKSKHSETEKFECDTCKRIFNTREYLEKHVKAMIFHY